jgi:hypothetical protein
MDGSYVLLQLALTIRNLNPNDTYIHFYIPISALKNKQFIG